MHSVQVIGTNGKGTVSIYLAALFSACGYKTGLFTSPHIVRETERVKIDGAEIPIETLHGLMQKHKDESSDFGVYTSAARDWFCENGVSAAVWECGLGGRLDPTTRLPRDLLILTRIGLDHTDLLGDTIEKIAEEKCAAIIPGKPVVSQPQEPPVRDIIIRECLRKNAPLIWVAPPKTGKNGEFSFKNIHGIRLLAIGVSQPLNAVTALTAIDALGLAAPEEVLCGALAEARFIGRIEYLPEFDMVVDGGHNAGAIAELSATLDARFPGRRRVYLCAAMSNKDVSALARLADGSTAITTHVNGERGMPAAALAELFGNAIPIEDFYDAFECAQKEAKLQNALLVACGSFYLAGRIEAQIDAKKADLH